VVSFVILRERVILFVILRERVVPFVILRERVVPFVILRERSESQDLTPRSRDGACTARACESQRAG
jgi:hypothetical protein